MSKLEFPGGSVDVPTPKPDELLLSAQQWVTRALSELTDMRGADCTFWVETRERAARAALERALRALHELQGHV